jgi:hypothetical protein
LAGAAARAGTETTAFPRKNDDDDDAVVAVVVVVNAAREVATAAIAPSQPETKDVN